MNQNRKSGAEKVAFTNFLPSGDLPSVNVIFIYILSFYWLSHVLAFDCLYTISVTVFVILSLKMLQALRRDVRSIKLF